MVWLVFTSFEETALLTFEHGGVNCDLCALLHVCKCFQFGQQTHAVADAVDPNLVPLISCRADHGRGAREAPTAR